MLGHAGFIAPWYYNSSLFILIEQPKSWFATRGAGPALLATFKVLTFIVKIAILSGCAWLAVKSRPYLTNPRTRNHFRFNLSLLFFLMVSQTLWEHYLTVLFIPLSFLLATQDRFEKRAQAIVWSIIVLSIGQNLIFIHALQSIFTFQSLSAQIAVCVFKSAPIWIMIIFLWRYHQALFKAYETPANGI